MLKLFNVTTDNTVNIYGITYTKPLPIGLLTILGAVWFVAVLTTDPWHLHSTPYTYLSSGFSFEAHHQRTSPADAGSPKTHRTSTGRHLRNRSRPSLSDRRPHRLLRNSSTTPSWRYGRADERALRDQPTGKRSTISAVVRGRGRSDCRRIVCGRRPPTSKRRRQYFSVRVVVFPGGG